MAKITWSIEGDPTDPPKKKKIPIIGYRNPEGLWEMPDGTTYANPEPYVLKDEKYTAGSYPAVNGKIPQGRKYMMYAESNTPDGWVEYAEGGPIKPITGPKNITTPEGFSLPGELPNRADSLFLLNNNRILDAFSAKKGYKKYEHKSWKIDKEFTEKQVRDIEKQVRDEILSIKEKGIQKTNPSKSKNLSTYIDRKGQMIGTQDWLPKGGEDYFVEKSYIHPKIFPQAMGFSTNIESISKTGEEYHRVEIPIYHDLAITPWDMLSDAQKKERVVKYGTLGTPFETKTKVIPKTPQLTPLESKQPNIAQFQFVQEELQPKYVEPVQKPPKVVNSYTAAGYPMVGDKKVPKGRVYSKDKWEIIED